MHAFPWKCAAWTSCVDIGRLIINGKIDFVRDWMKLTGIWVTNSPQCIFAIWVRNSLLKLVRAGQKKCCPRAYVDTQMYVQFDPIYLVYLHISRRDCQKVEISPPFIWAQLYVMNNTILLVRFFRSNTQMQSTGRQWTEQKQRAL